VKQVLFVALLAAAVAAGVYGWTRTDPAGEQLQFRVVRVARGDVRITALATGVAEPQNRLEVKPPIAGRIEEIVVEEGDRVAKGSVLAWMSSVERAALLDVARAKGADELAHWEEIYRPAPLIAPLGATVIARNVEPGQSISAEEPVFVLSDRLIVTAQVDETDIGRIRIGQEASITLDAYPDTPILARVDHIAYEAKTVNNVTIYEVDVLPAAAPAVMRSGMTANVTFRIEDRENVLVLPAEAVERREGAATVRMSSPTGAPRAQSVDVGADNGQEVEILAGLSEGDEVLVPIVQLPERGRESRNPFFPSAPRRPREGRS